MPILDWSSGSTSEEIKVPHDPVRRALGLASVAVTIRSGPTIAIESRRRGLSQKPVPYAAAASGLITVSEPVDPEIDSFVLTPAATGVTSIVFSPLPGGVPPDPS